MHVLVLASFFTDGLCIFKGGDGYIFLVEGVQGWMETTMTTEKREVHCPKVSQNVIVRIDLGLAPAFDLGCSIPNTRCIRSFMQNQVHISFLV
jgi:hypothetical protein